MDYPQFGIQNLNTLKSINNLFTIDRLEDYIPKNKLVHQNHAHDFFHFVIFQQGTGRHWVDFQSFEVDPNGIYFMYPGQVHHWDFNDGIAGYIVNFSSTFLDANGVHSNILHQFSFFDSRKTLIQYALGSEQANKILQLLDKLYHEQLGHHAMQTIYQALLLVQILVKVERTLAHHTLPGTVDEHYKKYQSFLTLLEQHYREWHLPKQYAAALNMTPHSLNQLVQHYKQRAAGTLIRDRIILEAKRLIILFQSRISEISYELNFSDVSNFVKFFKKETGFTPEQFRKSILDSK